MKKLILTILVVAAMLLSTDISYGDINIGTGHGGPGLKGGDGGDINAPIAAAEGGKGGKGGDASSEQQQGQIQGQKQGQQQDQQQGQGQSQINEGNSTNVEIDNSTIIPAPILPVPGFINPNERTPYDESWTSNSFDLGKTDFTIAELRRVANPSRFLFLGWCEWDKSFKIEMACWAKSKPQSSVRVYTGDVTVNGFTKMGEAHARAVELHKSEKQVAAALCIYAAKQGAKVVIIRTFSNPVTKADSAVLGGAGASVTATGDIVNSAGGFGWTTAEKVFRSYVVAELYR